MAWSAEQRQDWEDKDPGKGNELRQIWKKKNPDKVAAHSAKGRDKKLSAQARYRQTDKYKEQSKAYRYMRQYGISIEDYTNMLQLQHGVCKICHKPETALNNKGEVKPLAVDHDHTTGKVRGLLCHKCNILLGKAEDNIMILQNAIFYLEEAKEVPN